MNRLGIFCNKFAFIFYSFVGKQHDTTRVCSWQHHIRLTTEQQTNKQNENWCYTHVSLANIRHLHVLIVHWDRWGLLPPGCLEHSTNFAMHHDLSFCISTSAEDSVLQPCICFWFYRSLQLDCLCNAVSRFCMIAHYKCYYVM